MDGLVNNVRFQSFPPISFIWTHHDDPFPRIFAVVEEVLHFSRVDSDHTEHELPRHSKRDRFGILIKDCL